MGSGMSIFRSQESGVRSQKIKTFINGAMREVATGTTVLELLNGLDIKPQGIAVELNLEIVPKSKYEETPLRDGDRVEIVRMVGGG